MTKEIQKDKTIPLTSIICLTILGAIALIGLFFGKETLIGISLTIGIFLFVVMVSLLTK